ncbi:hypothetical protein R2F25_30465 [Streptomyces sp. UP1A-1]|nr:hypothetical protein [Streptomyces sp. UP1A-1]
MPVDVCWMDAVPDHESVVTRDRVAPLYVNVLAKSTSVDGFSVRFRAAGGVAPL